MEAARTRYDASTERCIPLPPECLEKSRRIADHLETSDPRIFAVGESVEHNGQVYGLVAPLFEQCKVLAATITGNKGPVFQGWKPAAKLKIMGVDVFSAGDHTETEGTEVMRYEDATLGIYKKLLVRDNRLAGVVLVGDSRVSNLLAMAGWRQPNPR